MTPPSFWRMPTQPDVLFGRGVQTQYAAEPRGEYFIGLISRGGFRAERGRDRVTLHPGDLCVWDPSAPHSGQAVEARAWLCRMLVVEAGAFERVAGRLPAFPDPVVRDRRLAGAFARLHQASAERDDALARDTELLDVLRAIAGRSADAPPEQRSAAADRAVRIAREYLHDNVARTVSLAELAGVAATSPHLLVRSFRRTLGVPPHSYQIGLRLALARRMLERGLSAGAAASGSGFHDQSHLHRHFVRNFGLTPGAYASATVSVKDVQDRGQYAAIESTHLDPDEENSVAI